jgi:hypothetical protein
VASPGVDVSQLADIEEVVLNTPLTSEQQGQLFVEILSALDWEIDGVETWEDALAYFSMRRGG